MKKLFISIMLILSVFCQAQKIDNIIKSSVYTSYFSYETHTPLFVIYKLYHGGGNVSRYGMYFITNNIPFSSDKDDYEDTNYDIGHLCNAKDFSFDYGKEESTFRFYNAIPQTQKLNRGVWRTLESSIRLESQKDSILIICGGFDFNQTTKKNSTCKVPDYCFKIKKNLRTKLVECYLFKNDDSKTFKLLNLNALLELIKYDTSEIMIKLK